MSDLACTYGMTHADGEACGGYAFYAPSQPNALDKTKGSWLHTNKDGSVLYQADHCSSCGKRLPLLPLGEPQPDQEA